MPAEQSKRTLAVATHLLGIGLMAVGGGLIYVLIAIWPAVAAATAANTEPDATASVRIFGFIVLHLIPDSALLVLVVVSSALGSFVHAATSFSTYVGNRSLHLSWIWWYLLRILIGVALASTFYLAIRGGFLAAQADTSDVNPYGMAALAGLVGLFSKQATDKLEEVFTTLFRVQDRRGDALRKDKAALPRPRLFALEPETVPSRAMASLRLLGEGFGDESAVRVIRADNGHSDIIAEQQVTGSTTIELTIEERFLAEPGVLELTVVNPAPGGGTSNALTLRIEDAEPEPPARRQRRLIPRRRRGSERPT